MGILYLLLMLYKEFDWIKLKNQEQVTMTKDLKFQYRFELNRMLFNRKHFGLQF